MKAKIIYLLINTARGSLTHQPHAVCGASQKCYGHATFDKTHNAHVFRMDQKTYEGGAALDIINNAHRSLQKWEVRCLVEAEMDEHETQLANDLDQAKGELAKARQTIAILNDELATARGMLESTLKELEQFRSGTAPVPKPETVAPDPVKRVLTIETSNDWSYNELKDEARLRGIDFPQNISKVKLLELLLPA